MSEWTGKRFFDLVCTLPGLIVLSPVFLAVALAVKIDSRGPVFFRQERVGKDGKIFKIYKFRTMVQDASALGQHFTTASGDARVTRLGGFLRRYNIDELAQLINVLAGQMSLVGPRPEVPEIVKLYNDEQKKVLSVRPGLTDYASLEFRKEGEIMVGSKNLYNDYIKVILPQKLDLQLLYVRKQSFAVDISLIMKTIWSIVGG